MVGELQLGSGVCPSGDSPSIDIYGEFSEGADLLVGTDGMEFIEVEPSRGEVLGGTPGPPNPGEREGEA